MFDTIMSIIMIIIITFIVIVVGVNVVSALIERSTDRKLQNLRGEISDVLLELHKDKNISMEERRLLQDMFNSLDSLLEECQIVRSEY